MAISPIGGGAQSPAMGLIATLQEKGPSGQGFEQTIGELIKYANGHQVQADGDLKRLVAGETDSVHDVVLSMAKADLSFRLMLEVRNQLVEAYQDIMRMQV